MRRSERTATTEGAPLSYGKPGSENPFFIVYGGGEIGTLFPEPGSRNSAVLEPTDRSTPV